MHPLVVIYLGGLALSISLYDNAQPRPAQKNLQNED